LESTNYASYKPGSFTIDISNFEKADQLFHETDMAAFVHEYCHYIQDITTMSSIFGFSLWLRDLASLINIFSNGQGNTITIPLERDIYQERAGKFRNYYSLYCGNGEIIKEINYTNHPFVQIHFEIKDILLDGNIQKLGVNEIELSGLNEKLYFGLIVLQEINAYYAQVLAEAIPPLVNPKKSTAILPSYPYKFGDFLFDSFQIEMDLETKFILTGMCLDTVQAPTIFLKVLEELKGGQFGFNDLHYLELIVQNCREEWAYSNQDAFENILPDLQMWANSSGREELTAALQWYLEKINTVQEYKRKHTSLLFLKTFCMDWPNIALLFHAFPPPVYMDKGLLSGNVSFSKNADSSKFYKDEFEAASTFWAHKILFDLLTSKNIAEINRRCECPLFEGCEIRKEDEDAYTYICKTSPWEIIKDKLQAPCIYGMAAHSFGLWQNTLDFNFDAE
jgi:hypothetical protein